MFNFLKKKDDTPPDVGQEEKPEASQDAVTDIPVEPDDYSEEENTQTKNISSKSKKGSDKSERADDFEVKTSRKNNSSRNESNAGNFSPDIERNNLALEKINARLEAMDSFVKGFNERFSNINQQIGEIRAMNLQNEKTIIKATSDAMKTIDIVNEVKPDKLRLDYQKLDMKFQEFSERLEANKQFGETIMDELKDLRRKAGIFVGTDALLKLNEDVKKDILEMQKTASRVKMNADKSEEIFVSLKKGFAENDKLNEVINNMDLNYSGMRKELEKLKLDHSDVVKQSDFSDLKKKIDYKLSFLEKQSAFIQKIGDENERLGNIIEKIFGMSKRNEEDIANIGITIGNDKIKRVSDYEEEIASLLRVIDTLAGQITDIKKRIGMVDEKKIIPEKNGLKTPVNDKFDINDLDSNKKVRELLNEGNASIEKGDSANAKAVYKKIKDLYNSQDDISKELYNKIVAFYNKILKK